MQASQIEIKQAIQITRTQLELRGVKPPKFHYLRQHVQRVLIVIRSKPITRRV